MLDDKHRDALVAHTEQRLNKFLGLSRIESRSGFVQEQHPRTRRERPADL
jgi:hypothetical protein